MNDAIIVLAGGINEDGSLVVTSEKRTEKATGLYHAGVSEWVVMSGKWSFWIEKIMPRTEAETMKQYAITLGVPAERIIKEEDSRDTLGNAYFSKKNILEPRGWKNVTVVTSDYHMERTKLIFNYIFGPDYKIDFVEAKSDFDPSDMSRRIAQEQKTIRFLEDWIQKMGAATDEKIEKWMFEQHPGYASNPGITKEQLLKDLGRSE